MKPNLRHLTILIFSFFISPIIYSQSDTISSEDYLRAEKFLYKHFRNQVFKNQITPNWINDTDNFWYKNDLEKGKEFFLVKPNSKKIKQPAFKQLKLAQSLSNILDSTFDASNLPFNSINFDKELKNIEFEFEQIKWKCNLKTYKIVRLDSISKPVASDVLVSPDGKAELFTKEYNLWLREIETKIETQLTFDGKKYYDYGSMPEFSGKAVTMRLLNFQLPPDAVWSPDSKNIITHRLDQINVKELALIQSVFDDGSLRPKVHSFKTPYPTDEFVPLFELFIINVNSGKQIKINHSTMVDHDVLPFFYENWWDTNGKYAYFIDIDRGYLNISLNRVAAKTGEVKNIITETDSTPIQTNLNLFSRPNIRILKNSEQFIWFSQRTGWGHLYLYETETGKLINQITSGEWNVKDIIRLDDVKKTIFFTAVGRESGHEPYYEHFYSVKFDGSELQLLTPENAFHEIKLSPSGNYFVDSYSRADLPTVSVLKNLNGKLLSELEKADISQLVSKGWKFPEQFKVKAADNVTDIFGLIYFPTNFNPQKKYPVIENTYQGAQTIVTPKTFAQTANRSAQALAELGFLVIILDGRGTPYRSKKFQDYCFGQIEESSSLEDHVFALKQLAVERPYMDLTKVGCYGHSGGGYGAAKAILKYPDFYKVAVSSAGLHDVRSYLSDWGDRYQGLYNGNNYNNQDNLHLAKNLKGKLLLAYGDMDDNVHPANTIQLIDALTKANKDYDLIILPNNNHSFSVNPYFQRRLFDYFVKNLKGCEPPKNYELNY
jgi:dipeptidyl aminopeptidase/acylaminoacyl peptidase